MALLKCLYHLGEYYRFEKSTKYYLISFTLMFPKIREFKHVWGMRLFIQFCNFDLSFHVLDISSDLCQLLLEDSYLKMAILLVNNELFAATKLKYNTTFLSPSPQHTTISDRENNDFLSDEYCFFDGTFKRCPGFVTLGVHVYVDLLRKIVKIATMECESESTEKMTIFWSLLNEVLETFTGKKGYKFNPVGWAVDEHGGNWASIRAVYGEEAVNARTVSCGFHFKQSIVRHAKHVGSAKSQTQFKVLANKLLSSVTVKNYDEAYLGLKNFIEKKPEKRGFLTSWLEWWNERKEHFANAFKPFGAAPVNLSEAYHSSYVTTGSKGLKLIDAAYKDVVIALCLEIIDAAYKDVVIALCL